MSDVPVGYRKATPTMPYGYKQSDVEGYVEPIPEIQEKLDVAIGYVNSLSMSVRKAAEWLSLETGKSLSYESLRKIIVARQNDVVEAKKQEGVVEAPPGWITSPENYERDEEGNFILSVKGVPRKIRGKNKGSYNRFHSSTKAKLAVRADIRSKKKVVEKLESKLTYHKASLKAKKEVANILDAGEGKKTNVATIVSESDLGLLPRSVREQIDRGESKVAFRPNKGPQEDFLASDEKDVLYGGAAGGKDKSFYRLLST